MRYEKVKFDVGNEQFDVIHCLGDGQCECGSCKEKGKWSLSWTSWFYKLSENDDGVLCRNCLAEILIQRRIDKAIKNKIEQGTLIELPCKVGDIFYGISAHEVFKYMVLAIKLVRNNKIVLCTVYDIEFILGKDAFLTREEAEKRLKELQE